MVEYLSGTGITFCEALARLAEGKEMRRQQWPPYKYLVMERTEVSPDTSVLYIRTQSIQGHNILWDPTQVDILSMDWEPYL